MLLTIRAFELALLRLFERGAVSGTTHTCLGQEYVPVAVSSLLTTADFVFSNHRGHGHYLARYDDPEGLLAEIMGRQGAVCGGVGGSQHILRDRYLSTGVQGESLPVAAGVALHLRTAEPGRLACTYIGDGTWGEGSVYEALNIASLWRLPLLLVVENNGIAQSTPTPAHMAGTVAGRAAAFDVPSLTIISDDVTLIRDLLGDRVRAMRADPHPLVVEFVTRRVGPHSKGDDSRTREQLAQVADGDWARRYAVRFPEQYARADAQAGARIEAIVRDVSARPPSGSVIS
jgi:pyruvate dehydrogenase E1 component alpha subunit